jgi:hypothetical protein
MAVNPQKLLPPPSSALVKVGKIKTSKKSENNSTDSINTIDAIKKELEKIKENLEKIYSLVLDNNKLTEKDLEVKRLSAERLKFAEKEKRLETKDPEKKDERDDKSIPKLGIFDRINRFITFTLLGWVAVRLVKYLPKLLEFSKNLLPVMEFFSSFTANFFKGVVDFIDFGYNAYDKVKDFVKGIGGEPFEKAFDDFSSNLNKFVNLAIIAGIAASGGTDFGLGKKPGKPGTQPKPKPGQGGRPRVTTSGGGGAGRPDLRNPLRQRPNITTSGGGGAGRPNIRNPLRQKPRVSTSGGGKIKLPSKGSIRAGGIASLVMLIPDIINSWSLISQGRPKDGIRTIISAVAGVGAGMAAMAGVTAGAAALGMTGVGLPAAIALAIAGFAASSAASWAAYEGSEALLKRMGLVDKDPETNEPYAYKSGGHVKTRGGKRRGRGASTTRGGKVTTRGGKKVGGPAQRKVRRVVKRIVTPPKSTPIAAGKSVGGKEKLKKLFPEPSQGQVGKTMDPYGYTTGTSEKLGQIPFLGPLFNIFGKTLLGDLPNKSDYQKVGMGLGAWINTAVSQGQLQGDIVSAFSDGGMIEGFGRSDISGWVEKSVEELVKNKVTEAINELKRNLGLESLMPNDRDVRSGYDHELETIGIDPGTEIVGYVGSTGRSTGPHIHFENLTGAKTDLPSSVRDNIIVGGKPMSSYIQTSGPGPRWGKQHNGEDWAMDSGLPIQLSGGLKFVKYDTTSDPGGWGNFLVIQDQRGTQYLLGHLSRGPQNQQKIQELQRQRASSKITRPKDGKWKVGDTLSVEDMAKLLKEVGATNDEAITLAAIGVKESSGRTKSHNDNYKQGKGDNSYGLFQINMIDRKGYMLGEDRRKRYGIRNEDLFDPYTNAQIALKLKRGSEGTTGYNIWSPYRNNILDANDIRRARQAITGKKDGGIIGQNIQSTQNINSIQTQASYDDGQSIVMLIQPVIIEKQIPMRTGGTKIAFIGGVNSNNNNSSLFVG